jgi:tetratricopeptide (TPR) repeat protein
MPLMKRLGGSVRSFFGVLDKITEEKLEIAIELATQAAEQYDDYNATNNIDCLHTAVDLSQKAVDTLDKGHSTEMFKRTDILGEFVHNALRDQCLSLRALFFETDDIIFLEQCIGILRLLYANAPKSSRYYILEAGLLSRTFFDRYFAHGEKNKSDAKDAAAAAHAALSVSLKFKYRSNFVSSEDDGVLTLALEDARQIANTPLQIQKGVFLYSRGGSLIRRYHRQRNIKALRTARSCLTEAIQLFPPTHEKHAKAVVELANCEVLYIDNTSDTGGLDSVIQLIDSLDVSNPLSNSGTDNFIKATTTKSLLFRARFDYISDPADLDRAVEIACLATNPSIGKVQLRVDAWENYSNQLTRRAEVRQSTIDMNAAIEAAKMALNVCPKEYVQLQSSIYATVGRRLGDKWSLFGGDSDDLIAAIEPLRNAITVLPKNYGSRAIYLHNLAHVLRDLFLNSGSIEPLEESIQVEREALSVVLEGDTQKYVMLDGLALSLNQRFRRLQHSEDLYETIQASEDALAGTPKGELLYISELPATLNLPFQEVLDTQSVFIPLVLHCTIDSCGRSKFEILTGP